jgi:hypothetical protein
MDQKPQREAPILDGLALVLDDQPKLVDLVSHAAVFRVVG